MSDRDQDPRRLLEVAVFTAAAFIAGGFIQRFLASELATDVTVKDAFSLWVLVPVLAQGAVGFLGLAWIVRDRFPAVVLWFSGMLGLAFASFLVLPFFGWSYYDRNPDITGLEGSMTDLAVLFGAQAALGLVTGLVMSGMMQVGAAAIFKKGLAYSVGFTLAEFAKGATFVAVALTAVYVPWLLPAGISVDVVWTIGDVVRDCLIGVTSALALGWALGRSVLPSGAAVYYELTEPAHRRTHAGAR